MSRGGQGDAEQRTVAGSGPETDSSTAAENAVSIPAGALHPGPTARLRQGNTTITRTVQIGLRGDHHIEIRSGLNPGDQVVT